ncbi:hypothetical protein CPB85DRAFT_1434058 [Mucidula mucida]|nr:hypothetical protein CPB85DRAFT_1434058 [Mucidula mucida]
MPLRYTLLPILLGFLLVSAQLVPNPTGPIEWTVCDERPNDPHFSCAFYDVPLDWTDPSDDRKATIFLAKYSPLSSKTLGTVFYNPGGPGISGATYILQGTGERLSNRTGGQYDIIDVMEDRFASLQKQCKTMEGGAQYMEYIGTTATVRDLVALADSIDGVGTSINYIGVSYGTVIGSYLVNMFPDRVGKIVIDGVVNPDYYARKRADLSWRRHVESADEAFQGFAQGCKLAGPYGCILANSPVTNGLDIIAWTHDLDVRAYDSYTRGIGEGSFILRAQLFNDLYSPAKWSDLSKMLYNYDLEVRGLTRSNVKRTERDALFPRETGGSPPSESLSLEAITCGDSVDRGDTTSRMVLDELEATAREVSGLFGARFLQYHICHMWPVRAKERFQGPFNQKLANPILVIGNTADPITPFIDAQLTAEELGDSAILIKQNGFGQSACTHEIIRNFFVYGTHPTGEDTICEVQDMQVFSTKNISTSDIAAHLATTNGVAASYENTNTKTAYVIAIIVLGALVLLLATALVVLSMRSRRRYRVVGKAYPVSFHAALEGSSLSGEKEDKE